MPSIIEQRDAIINALGALCEHARDGVETEHLDMHDYPEGYTDEDRANFNARANLCAIGERLNDALPRLYWHARLLRDAVHAYREHGDDGPDLDNAFEGVNEVLDELHKHLEGGA